MKKASGKHSSRELLLATIHSLSGELAVPTEQWCLIGFSQGCTMVLETALRGPRFAGVVGISRYLPTISEFPAGFGPAARTTPLLITHGRYDDVLDFQRTEALAEFLQEYDCMVTFEAYNKGHELDINHEVPVIRNFLNAYQSA